MTPPAPSIFESFNARSLDPAQVARTFVPSLVYGKLAKRRHTIIVGPRGSGKTTLLKMLQQPALEEWSHPESDTYRGKIDFTGVFVPTDLIWSEQLKSLGDGLDKQTVRLLGAAAFTTHVLRGLTTSMIDRTSKVVAVGRCSFRRVEVSRAAECDLARFLSEAWHLKIGMPSFAAVYRGLGLRLSRIYEIASKEALLGRRGREKRLAAVEFLQLHFLQSSAAAVDMFNDVVGERSGKWAFAFDELELAPVWIQDELVKLLRSTDQRFIFKLAMSPYTNSVSQLLRGQPPSANQDFDEIPLWYPNKRDAYSFCEELWHSMIAQRGYPARGPQEVLGTSYFHSSSEELARLGGAYAPGTALYDAFKSLSDHDRSFRHYLEAKDINLAQISGLEESRRAAEIRKVASVVALRGFYRGHGEGGASAVRGRSRKKSFFVGAEALFAISEGNPRWFIGITESLLDRWKDQSKPIDESIQSEETLKASERYSAMLATIPIPAGRPVRNLLEILESVGRFFHEQVVKGEFTAEPPGTFEVDKAVPVEVSQLLEPAVNAGAIVYVPARKGEAFVVNMTGKRFRISYMLAPLYRIPLRLGKPANLSRILILKRSDADQLPLGYRDNE